MSAMPSSKPAAAERPPAVNSDLDRLFDRLVAELRATSIRLAAGRAAR